MLPTPKGVYVLAAGAVLLALLPFMAHTYYIELATSALVAAMLALTTATLGVPLRSSAVNPRPRRIRVPIVLKYSGVVAVYENRPSIAVDPRSGRKKSVEDVLTNGAVLTQAADSTSGSDLAVASRFSRTAS